MKIFRAAFAGRQKMKSVFAACLWLSALIRLSTADPPHLVEKRWVATFARGVRAREQVASSPKAYGRRAVIADEASHAGALTVEEDLPVWAAQLSVNRVDTNLTAAALGDILTDGGVEWYFDAREPYGLGALPTPAHADIAIIDSGLARAARPLFSDRLSEGYDFISSAALSGDGDGRDGDPTDPGDPANANCRLAA